VSELYALIAMGYHCPPRIAALQDSVFAAGQEMGLPDARVNLLARLFRNTGDSSEELKRAKAWEGGEHEDEEHWPKATTEELKLILHWVPNTTEAELEQLLADYPQAVGMPSKLERIFAALPQSEKGLVRPPSLPRSAPKC
jgi:hypothetical protein